jgi:hypothetical protein
MLPPQKPQPISAAARNAEALFEAKNVTEIRQVPSHVPAVKRFFCHLDVIHVVQLPLKIEARTRQDIEEKNLQLRQLVGDSYRYLLLALPLASTCIADIAALSYYPVLLC